MLLCRITFVTREAVTGIQSIKLGHEAVAMHLGEDRCGRDREVDPVALVEAALRLRHAGDGAAVDQNVLRLDGEGAERNLHPAQARGIEGTPNASPAPDHAR